MMLMILQKCVNRKNTWCTYPCTTSWKNPGDKINLEFYKDNKLRHTEPLGLCPRRCI